MKHNIAYQSRYFLLALSISLAACVHAADQVHPPAVDNPPLLVESFPIGTTLDSDLPDAADTWLSMIRRAESSIDLAEFYVSDDPNGASSLTTIIGAIRERASKGVKVRLLVEEKFYRTYPAWVDQLDSLQYVEARRLDYSAVAGGVLHAKYFVVDDRAAFVGSQNFDWRALEHIQELGLVLTDHHSAVRLARLFQSDWERGAPVASAGVDSSASRTPNIALTRGHLSRAGDDATNWQLVVSPEKDRPEFIDWDLPHLIEMIDSARDSIAVQLLTYKPKSRTGEMWDELDGALRRAAKRGVAVRLLLANWGKRAGTVEYLQELSQLPGFQLRFMNIPEWSGGFIPFARTVHAKYMVVDGRRFWLGTSNWERDYFYNSRNVGIVGEGQSLGAELSQFFRNGWDSEYAEVVRAETIYEAPRIAE